ncbi:MAG: endonuclease III domain-containing protein [Thermoplasmata archaeon]
MIFSTINEEIEKIYHILLEFFGQQGWWPAETPYEVVVGAILTQNTSWRNVKKAIKNLKDNNLLDLKKIAETDIDFLAELIKPSGFYRQKAIRLKNISLVILKDFGNIENMRNMDTEKVMEYLLSLNGIGSETAESILLYALDKPVFVVDSYTIRIFGRMGLPEKREDIKKNVMNIFKDVNDLKEFHALLVELGKNYCKKIPLCNECPLNEYCKYYRGENE